MYWHWANSDKRKILGITGFYVVINWYITFYNEALLNSSISAGQVPGSHWTTQLLINTMVGLLAGLFGGTLLLKVYKTVFRRTSFRQSLLTALLVFVLVFAVVALLTSTAQLMASRGWSGFGPSLISEAVVNSLSQVVLVYFLLWLGISLFTIFMFQVNDKFGPGVLRKFLLGRYHQPRTEDRIFLFLDMKSSTTIAEKIGNEKYFSLLHDVFTDIADSITEFEGEIYQYVGDEVVVSWPLQTGFRDLNALQCFADIRRRFLRLSSYYQQEYGVVPSFKGGLHHGPVTAGELGSIKRDIVYSGDVLNTTARIQELCNRFGVDFLMSKSTMELFQRMGEYEVVSMGSHVLRGREESVELHSIRWPDAVAAQPLPAAP